MLTVKRRVAKPFSVERSLRRLAAAVLVQALQDATAGPRRSRDDSWEWFNGRSRGEFTFEFCCSLLGHDPDELRFRLRERHIIPKPAPPVTLGHTASPNFIARRP